MKFQLRTLILVQVAIAAFVGWWADHYYQARSYRAQLDARAKEAAALKEEIAVRDLNVKVLEAIVAARSAKSQHDYEQACQDVRWAMVELIDYGPRGKIAMRSYVEAAKVPWWSGSDYDFALVAPEGLAAVGPEGVPFLLDVLKSENTNVRRLAAQSLVCLVHPNWHDQVKRQLSPEEAQQIVEPIQKAAATEQDHNVRVKLNRVLAWVLRKERYHVE